MSPVGSRLPTRTVLIELTLSLARLAGIGLLAVAASGALALGFGAVFGHAFVAGDPPGVTYTASRCHELLEYQPRAASCAQAALENHFTEVVVYRLAAGAFGAALVGGTWWLSRRRRARIALPPLLVPTIATTAFGLAAIAMFMQAADLALRDFHAGAGSWLAAAAVAGACALSYGVPLLRSVVRDSTGS
jgi:hypothetical protein